MMGLGRRVGYIKARRIGWERRVRVEIRRVFEDEDEDERVLLLKVKARNDHGCLVKTSLVQGLKATRVDSGREMLICSCQGR